jgi:hypothetical protein
MPQQRRKTLLVMLAWLASRVPLYLLATGHIYGWYGRKSDMDVMVYQQWTSSLTHGSLPLDPSWQYPPLVGPLLLLPKLVPGAGYYGQFIRLAFIADALVMGVLLLTARRRENWMGAWFWVAGVPMLGPLIYGRFDVFSALLVVAALALLGKGVPSADGGGARQLNGRRWVAGILIGLGAAVKIWPALVFFGLPRTRRGLQTIAVGAAAAAAATLLSALALRHSTWFLHNQGSRGIEVESLWAIPFLTAELLHLWHGKVESHFGSLEVLGADVNIASDLALVSTGIVFALLAWWWWRKQWRPAVAADATLVATLMMIVTSRVISPQYLIWLLATAAFCLLSKDTSQRRSALLVLISLPISQWIFPYNFDALVHFRAVPVLVLIVRDALLLAATAIGFADLWRDTVSGPFLPRRARTAEQPVSVAIPAPAPQGSRDSSPATPARGSHTSV